MNSKKFSEAMGELDNKYVDEAINYKKKAKKPGWIKWGTMAACLAILVAIGGIFTHHDGGMVVRAYAYETDEEITAAGAVISAGTISDTGEMKGHPLMFYLSGKDIETVRFSCKNQQINFMDWTETRDEYGNAQNFTVTYGEDESEYYYLTIDWVPNTIIRALTDNAETTIATLPAELREDIIVMEITFINGKTTTKAITVSLMEDGRFFATFDDYKISEADDFIKRTDSVAIPRDVLYTQNGSIIWGEPDLGDIPLSEDYDPATEPKIQVDTRVNPATGEEIGRKSVWGEPDLGDIPLSEDYDPATEPKIQVDTRVNPATGEEIGRKPTISSYGTGDPVQGGATKDVPNVGNGISNEAGTTRPTIGLIPDSIIFTGTIVADYDSTIPTILIEADEGSDCPYDKVAFELTKEQKDWARKIGERVKIVCSDTFIEVSPPIGSLISITEEVPDDEVKTAEEAAEEYYSNTVFEVVSLKLKSQTENEIIFSVCVSKGGEVQEPNRTIILQLNNETWEVINEGY